MSEISSVWLIEERVDAAAALDIVRYVTAEGEAVLQRRLYYPYYFFNAVCSVPVLFRSRQSTVSCLVDGVNGVAATADTFATRHSQLATDSLLRLGISGAEADSAARRYLRHHLTRRLRVIAAFNIRLVPAGCVYKAFWVARSGQEDLMIDTMTGSTHPLRRRAA